MQEANVLENSTSPPFHWQQGCQRQTRILKRKKPMPSQLESQEKPPFDISKASETVAERRLERAAEESAEKAEKTEQRYDSEHDIFTK